MRGTSNPLAALLIILVCAITANMDAQDQILYSVTADNVVYTANLDGSGGNTALVSPAAAISFGPTGMDVDFTNSLIYIAGGNSGDVAVAPLSGGAASSLANSTVGAAHRDVHVDAANSRYFFSTNDANGVWVAATNGTGSATQVGTTGPPLSSPHGLAYDAASGNVYATDIVGGIYSINAVSGLRTQLFATVGGPRGLAIDVSAGKIYWTQFGGGTTAGVYSGNLDGSGSPSLLYSVTSGYRPHGVFIDHSTQVLYWVEFQQFVAGSRIMTAAADGSGSPAILYDLPTAINLRGIEFGQPIITTSDAIPTLSQWGLIIFGLLLLCSGAVVVWRRQYRLDTQAA